MYTLEQFLSNNKFKDNTNKLFIDSNLTPLINRLQFDESLLNITVNQPSNQAITQADLIPKILSDWQADEIRNNNVKNYFKNPFYNTNGTLLYNTINKLINHLLPGNNVNPVNNQLIPIPIIGISNELLLTINNTNITINTFIEHTNRLSNTIPEDQLIYLPSTFISISEFPHFITALPLAKSITQLTYQVDANIIPFSPKIILSCFTSIISINDILSQINVNDVVTVTNTIISNSVLSTINDQSILTITLSPSDIININNVLNNTISVLNKYMLNDIVVYNNMLNINDEINLLTDTNDNDSQIQNYLVNDVISTNKLKLYSNVQDNPTNLYETSIDYFGNVSYTQNTNNIIQYYNTYSILNNDYINTYDNIPINANTNNIILSINPAALLFNTTNGTYYNRSITITNLSNSEWNYHDIYVNDFNYTEVKCNINWANTTNGTTTNNTINLSEYVFREKTYIYTINVKNNYINFALNINGGIVSVSSNTKSVINNGSRYYTNTNSTWYPSHQANTDWAIIEFNTTKTINKINFISQPITNDTEPTTEIDSYYIIPNINIEYWNGNTWILIETIISDKSIIEVNFDHITTNKIRIYCVHTDWFNILELEAWGYEPLNYKSNTFINNGLDYIIQYKDNLNKWKIIPNGNISNTSNNYNTILINNGIITNTIKITSNQSSYYQYSNPIELELIGTPYYNTLQPNNSITLSIDVRSLIPTDYNDYGNITIENIEIPIRIINSNNDIGIMSELDTNVIIGNTTNKLLINEINGPYQLLSNNPSLQRYTYINKTEYPVTINDIISLYDNNNADIILIDAEYPITLNTNDYILLSANVIPYNTNIDDFGWLIVTEDGQERILKLFITNIDDSNLYNEIITISNTSINISNGKPYDIVNVIGPTTISPFYLANNGTYIITDIDPGTYTLTFGTGHNKTIDLFSNKDVAKEVLGLVIGSNVQAYNANLTNFGSLTKAANNFIVANGSSWITTSGSDTRSRLGLVIGSNVQAYNANLKDIGNLSSTANNFIVANGSSWITTSGSDTRSRLGLVIGDDVQAYNAKLTNFGNLTSAANNFIIGNGSSWITTSGSDTRSRLGLVIGDDVQAYNDKLKDIGNLASTANNFIIGNGDSWSSYGPPGARSRLGLVINDDVQAYNAKLKDIGNLASTANNFIIGNGDSWSSFGAVGARSRLGLVIGTNVQAYNDKLKDIGNLSSADNNFIVGNGDTWVAETASVARVSMSAAGVNGSTSEDWSCANLTVFGDIIPTQNVAFDIGSTTRAWDKIYYRTAIGVSDERYKTDIIDSDLGLDFINELHPVKYKWRKSKVKSKDTNNNIIYTETVGTNFNYGLIADEVGITLGQRDFGGYVEDIESGEKGLVFDQFVVVLIKAVQELTTEFNNEKNIRIELEKRIEKLEKLLK